MQPFVYLVSKETGGLFCQTEYNLHDKWHMSKGKMTSGTIADELMDHEVLRTRVGLRLAHAREHLGLTQSEVAEKTKFSASYIGRCESGQRMVSVELLVALQVVYGISDRHILYGVGPVIHKLGTEPTDLTDLDDFVDEFSEMVDRLREWRSGFGPSETDNPKSNAKVVGTRRRASAESVAKSLNKRKKKST